ncbi:hypothetical protein Tco_0436876 [Tanacetum coccineum]
MTMSSSRCSVDQPVVNISYSSSNKAFQTSIDPSDKIDLLIVLTMSSRCSVDQPVVNISYSSSNKAF